MGPVHLNTRDKLRIRAAAFRATRLYPGPVGELISAELLDWEAFGYRLGGTRLVMRLVDHVLAAPLAPTRPETAGPEVETFDHLVHAQQRPGAADVHPVQMQLTYRHVG